MLWVFPLLLKIHFPVVLWICSLSARLARWLLAKQRMPVHTCMPPLHSLSPHTSACPAPTLITPSPAGPLNTPLSVGSACQVSKELEELSKWLLAKGIASLGAPGGAPYVWLNGILEQGSAQGGKSGDDENADGLTQRLLQEMQGVQVRGEGHTSQIPLGYVQSHERTVLILATHILSGHSQG